MIEQLYIHVCTVEPLNKGHNEASHCREVIIYIHVCTVEPLGTMRPAIVERLFLLCLFLGYY